MQNKKKDQPYMPFYYGDWRKAPEIRALDLDVRMIWFEMLGFMWESTDRGFLTINDNPVSTSVITKMVGVEISVMQSAIAQMEMYNVFSRRADGAIYCRRMVKEEKMRLAKSNAGKAGMKKRYDKPVANPAPLDPPLPDIIIPSVSTSVITETITNTDIDIVIDNKDSNKGDIQFMRGVQGGGNSGGKEEGLEIDHYPGHWDMETEIKNCLMYYLTHDEFINDKWFGFELIKRQDVTSPDEIIWNRLMLFGQRFTEMKMGSHPKTPMRGHGSWVAWFHNWVKGQNLTSDPQQSKKNRFDSLSQKNSNPLPTTETHTIDELKDIYKIDLNKYRNNGKQ